MIINKIAFVQFMVLTACGCTPDGVRSGEGRSYPTVGVSFKTPANWKEYPRNKAKTLATWVSPDSTLDRPWSMITVETGKPTDQSLEATAQGLAKNLSGHVDGRQTTLDGSRTLRIVAKHSEGSLQPVIGLVTFHEGRVYLVIGASLPERSVADEVEAIRASWKWTPIEPSHKHLEFAPKAVPIFGGAAIMRIPERMFAYPTEHPDRILDLGLENIQRNQADFYAYVQLVEMPAGSSFDDFLIRIEKNLTSKLELEAPPEWRTRSMNPRRIATQVLFPKDLGELVKDAGNPPIRFAVVKLSERQLIVINFTIAAKATPEERAAYESLSDRMIDSIKSQ